MSFNLARIKDLTPYLKKELKDLYEPEEISSLSLIIIKTIFRGYRLHQVYDPQQSIDQNQSAGIISITEELKTGKPYQYVLGETEFYDCKIKVSPAVLIPRPETEELADIVIRENKDFRGEILDIGTGSGCIAIAIARNITGGIVTGWDISGEALELAAENARLNNAPVKFEKKDILSFDPAFSNKAGIIVSNPPYVRMSEKKNMKRNVLDFEPASALFVEDSDPLRYYREILRVSEKLLQPGGKVYFEINEALGDEMKKLMDSFGFRDVFIVKDLNNRDRIAKGIKNG